MIFKYSYIDKSGKEEKGTIESLNRDSAIRVLQSRGFILTSIVSEEDSKTWKDIEILGGVKQKDVVILSRQISTLFTAKVSALKVFQLLSEEVTNDKLRLALEKVSSDLQAGSTIAGALGEHPSIFTEFYVNMVAAGEESGRLDETFIYLADYLDRTYEVTSKVKNAMVYPTFVIVTFIAVMTMMLGLVIPKITQVLIDNGGEIPIYTKITIALSNLVVNFGLFVFVIFVGLVFWLYRYSRTKVGAMELDKFKLKVPIIGGLFKMLYLSRFSDNMNTMLRSGISMTRSLETAAAVVGSPVYGEIFSSAAEQIRGGRSVADALNTEDDAMPGILLQMVKIGEETGELGNILSTLSSFYKREVDTKVDTIISLIEPAMIILLGVGVGFLLTSVLLPIYNISNTIV